MPLGWEYWNTDILIWDVTKTKGLWPRIKPLTEQSHNTSPTCQESQQDYSRDLSGFNSTLIIVLLHSHHVSISAPSHKTVAANYSCLSYTAEPFECLQSLIEAYVWRRIFFSLSDKHCWEHCETWATLININYNFNLSVITVRSICW